MSGIVEIFVNYKEQRWLLVLAFIAKGAGGFQKKNTRPGVGFFFNEALGSTN